MQTGLPYIPSQLTSVLLLFTVYTCSRRPYRSMRITTLFFVPLCLSLRYELVKGFGFHDCGSHASSSDEQAAPDIRLTGPTPLLIPRQQSSTALPSATSSVNASQTATANASSTAVPQPTPILVFNALPQFNTCAPAVLSWNYAGPAQEEVSLIITSVNSVLGPDHRFGRRQLDGYGFMYIIATVFANSTNYTWSSVNVPQGAYNLTASPAKPTIFLAVVSESVFVANGTNTSCLPSLTPETPTPSPFANSSRKHTGAIVGGIVGTVVFLLVAFFIFFFARAARRKKRNANLGRRPWGGLQSMDSQKPLKEQSMDRARTRTSSRTSLGFVFGFGGKASDDDVANSSDEKIVSTPPFNARSPNDQIPFGLPPLPFQAAYPQPPASDAQGEDFNPYNIPIREGPRLRASTLSSIPVKPPTAHAHTRHASVTNSASMVPPPTRKDVFASYSDHPVEMMSLPSSPTTGKPPRRVRTPRKPVPRYEGAEENSTPSSSYNDASGLELASGSISPATTLSVLGNAGSESMFGSKPLHYLIPDPPPRS